LTACLAIIVIGTGNYFLLDTMQKPSGIAFSTEGARIDPQWSWRFVFRPAATGASATQTAANVPAAPGELLEPASCAHHGSGYSSTLALRRESRRFAQCPSGGFLIL
jgi:hypothetical protein